MTSRDLTAVTAVALSESVTVVLVEQPYRVAGRRSPAPARQLDAAWTAVIDELRPGVLRGLPLVVGGRSSGARVACRTAEATGAVAVLCLAFPFQPPPRLWVGPAPSRLTELDALKVPTLVVQGARDRFGIPPAVWLSYRRAGAGRSQPAHGPRSGGRRGTRLACRNRRPPGRHDTDHERK